MSGALRVRGGGLPFVAEYGGRWSSDGRVNSFWASLASSPTHSPAMCTRGGIGRRTPEEHADYPAEEGWEDDVPSDDGTDDDDADDDEEPFEDEEEEEHLALADSSAIPMVDPVLLGWGYKGHLRLMTAPLGIRASGWAIRDSDKELTVASTPSTTSNYFPRTDIPKDVYAASVESIILLLPLPDTRFGEREECRHEALVRTLEAQVASLIARPHHFQTQLDYSAWTYCDTRG
ncbi:hypothetical protein Tco_1539499 [Tanacetum coccineum]